MTVPVTVARDGEIAVVTLDNPPVNALSHHLRDALYTALQNLRDDADVAAVVLACAGRTFVAGADITEFGKPAREPGLHDLIDLLETYRKPTVAAIHGTALGGGLELAMGCHFRVAVQSAKLGLPEVKLGILPGAGGTQRLPRLLGPVKALKMVVSGTPVSAQEAAEGGLVDHLVADDLVAGAIDFARRMAGSGQALTLVRDRDEKLAAARADRSEFEAAASEVARKSRGLDAPAACIQSVRNSVDLSFDEAIERERQFFLDLVVGEQSKAQRHLFFAEREAAKVDGIGKDVKPRRIARVGVIGAGTMGGGIAMSFANGGIPVTLLEMSDDALKRGMGVIEKNYAISVSRGSLTEVEKAARLGRFTTTTDYADLADCDLIIEAVYEEMSVKKDVFGKLDQLAKPAAILASNTSYLDINEIAAATSRPGDVLGMHFFSPANVMKLLEIVRGRESAPDVIATALSVAKAIGKVPVVVGVCHGFVGNRMLASRSEELEDLLLEGATPEQVDRVFTDFGWPMGPFAMGDLAGLDIGWRNRKSLGKTAAIADALCEQGRFGQKTGKGFYLYEAGSRAPKTDPDVEQLIEDKARERGINRRAISDEEIAERTYYPMINEGAKILEEGIAARASDIDIVWVNGYGFPVGKGGPMHHADVIGLGHIADRLSHWQGKTGKAVFEPAPLLSRLAAEGKGFADLRGSKV